MPLKTLLVGFLDELEVWEERAGRIEFHKPFLAAINAFLDDPCPDTAQVLYELFLGLYWTDTRLVPNPFLRLVQTMHRYEQAAGRIVSRHRDHFVHSAFVFLLGLSVYASCPVLRDAMARSTEYPDRYGTKHEEFFYRWGFAALFHDIGYPVEITARQLKQYTDLLGEYPVKPVRSSVQIDFSDFSVLETIEPNPRWEADFVVKYGSFSREQLRDAISLLADGVCARFPISYEALESTLRPMVQLSPCEQSDHGCYGALVLLRWLHHLVDSGGWNPAYFYNAIIDSAIAVLLHTLYPKVLMKPPFALPKMCHVSSPLAYLLVLCDEIQEWSRPAYGPDVSAQIDGCDIHCEGDLLAVTYLVRRGGGDPMRPSRKRSALDTLLEIESVFPRGLIIDEREVCADG